MQTMNTDQQPYYVNQGGPRQPIHNMHINPMDPQYAIRHPNSYNPTARISAPYYNPQVPNNYPGQLYYTTAYGPQTTSFVHPNHPRGMNPNTTIIRPPNEMPNGTQTFIPATQYAPYGTGNMYQPVQPYPTAPYNTYSQPPNYTQGPTQLQYSSASSQPPTQASQTSQLSSDHQHEQSTYPSQSTEKRQRKPLAIVNPDTQKPVEINASTPSSNESSANTSSTTDENRQQNAANDSTIPPSKSTNDIKKEQQNDKFLKDFARILNPSTQSDKNTNQTSTNVPSVGENQEKPITSQPPIPEDPSKSKPAPDNSAKQDPSVPSDTNIDVNPPKPTNDQEKIESDQSDPMDENDILNNEPIEPVDDEIKKDDSENEGPTDVPIVEPMDDILSKDIETDSTNTDNSSSTFKRHNYSIEELRNKRYDPKSQERPKNLPFIPDIIIQPMTKPNEQFFRDITSILNKITPQTYEILLKQLENLEVNSSERLEGMISIIFMKAVETAVFCSLYANLCKHFQKKEVTVPNESGQMVKFAFRQFLLTRCQKEFEGDYRQEIKYEQRKNEVDAITDDKRKREAAEQLEEDLYKAKRKKLGNIIFIGELFKLQMLTDTIMYDCIEYLLRDKTDEESLECLCRLLRTIGKELDGKAATKQANQKNLEKNYVELENIITQRQASARIRFLIQDVLEERKAGWIARRAEVKPTTIDEIHEQARLKREQEERDQERDRQQRREQNRGYNNPQQYTGGRGSRGSGMKQQTNRTDEDRVDNRFANTIRQIQSTDKRNSGPPLSLAPQRAWSKGSGVEKKPEDDRSNTTRTGKPPAGGNQQYRPKTSTPPDTPNYHRYPSRELARENSQRERENAMESLRRTTSKDGSSKQTNTSMTNSREGSRNVSREQSRTTSPESTMSERTSTSTKPTTTTTTITTENTTEGTNTPFDEEKIQTRVHSLIEEYTENYSDNSERPVNDAIEDLTSFCTKVVEQQGFIVRELITNVLEIKGRARKAVGHLLDAALNKNLISNEGFVTGLKLFMEVVPDYAVDIPLIWQYIGEILGAFIAGRSANMIFLKSIFQLIPDAKSKQLFQDIIRYAIEFSSESNIQQYWQSASFSLNDFTKSDTIDSSFINEHPWLSGTTTVPKETVSPRADPHLVKLFKSMSDQSTTVTDEEILTYIRNNMNSEDKYYIRNIVLSYLEACLVTRDSQKKIQEDIVRNRMSIVNKVMQRRPEDEVQAVFAIQNFVHKLEHPPKMAQLLFDIFYDEDCVTEDAFFEWRRQTDPSETEGHSVVEMSTKDFFVWLEQADTEEGEEEEEE